MQKVVDGKFEASCMSKYTVKHIHLSYTLYVVPIAVILPFTSLHLFIPIMQSFKLTMLTLTADQFRSTIILTNSAYQEAYVKPTSLCCRRLRFSLITLMTSFRALASLIKISSCLSRCTLACCCWYAMCSSRRRHSSS